MTNLSMPSDLNVRYGDTRKTSDNYPFLAGGIAFDLYSDNSLLGLLFGANYTFLSTTYQRVNVSTDYFTVTHVEFPLYLKIRPGYVNGKNHVWILLGGVYSLPISIKREYDVIEPQSENDYSLY